MSDNPDSGQTPPEPAGNHSELPQWARDAISRANNEAAKFRTELRSKTEEHTAALAKIDELSGAKTAEAEKATAAEKELLKFRVAATSGVPLENIDKFVARLQGDDEATLKKDAEELLSTFGGPQKKPSYSDPSQGHGDGNGAGLSPGAAFIASRLMGIK